MPRGGVRKGGGRPAGSRNKNTVKQLEAVADGGITPLDYLLSVMRDTKEDQDARVKAATAAAPYCHARLHHAVIDDNRTDPLTELMDRIAESGRTRMQEIADGTTEH